MNKIVNTPAEHAAAMAKLSALMEGNPVAGTAEANELELLGHLVEGYEKRHHDLGLSDPLAAIAFRMEQQGLCRKDMVPYFGSQSRVSEVLKGKRPLTVGMLYKLHRELGIPAESLLGEPGREELLAEVAVTVPFLGLAPDNDAQRL